MAYTLRQVLPLLTKQELELFEASRAAAVKELSARQLTAKITRARALRDKYRDTYRRQTVATQTGPGRARKQMGGENSRTEVKAEVMAEVLQRLETQQAKVEARLAKTGARPAVRVPKAPGVPATKTNPKAAQRNRRTTGDAPASGDADQPMRGATGTKQRQIDRRDRAAEKAGYDVVTARGAKSTRAAGAAARPAAKAPRRPKDTNAITGDAHPVENLMRQVRGALQQQQGEPPVEGVPTPRRGIRSEVGGSPSDNAHGAVPTNMPALAQRLNPLKAEPVNKKIHASARGRQKVETAKRDAR